MLKVKIKITDERATKKIEDFDEDGNRHRNESSLSWKYSLSLKSSSSPLSHYLRRHRRHKSHLQRLLLCRFDFVIVSSSGSWIKM
jgi:hypothetical protein